MATPLTIPTRAASTVDPPADLNAIVAKINEMYPQALDIPTRSIGTGDPAGDVNKIVAWLNAHIATTTPTTPTAPAITAVDPTSALPGATIILTGAGFTGALNVIFAGVAVGSGKFQVLSDTQITVVVPPVSAGSNPVQVVGATATSSARAFVVLAAAANVLPVANAGLDSTIQLPTSQVVLMGSATDSDGTIAAYAWVQATGPNTALLASPNAQNTTASGLIAGIYQFDLTATDNKGGTNTDRVMVTVNAAAGSTFKVLGEGDSIVADDAAGHLGFPNSWLAQSRAQVDNTLYTGWLNFGRGGDAIGDASLDAYMASDAQKAAVRAGFATEAGVVTLLALNAAINDLQNGATAAVAYARYKALVNYYASLGARISGRTLMGSRLPGSSYDHAEFWTRVVAFNNLQRAGFNDGSLLLTTLSDLQTDPNLGGYNAPLNATYFRQDTCIHPTDLGFSIMAAFFVRELPYLRAGIRKVINANGDANTATLEQVNPGNTLLTLDSFDNAALPGWAIVKLTSQGNPTSAGNVQVLAGQLVVSPDSADGWKGGICRTTAENGIGFRYAVQLASPLSNTATGTLMGIQTAAGIDYDRQIRWAVGGGGLYAQYGPNVLQTNLIYDAQAHKYLGIRPYLDAQQVIQVAWEFSADGTTWSQFATRPAAALAVDIDYANLRLVLSAQTYGATSNPGSAYFDNASRMAA
ncbi:hypothetical protein GO988_11420 [Hymenobacter sp. HMF4947]|uniref:PKD/Chitinase domain-containing protein n=1 Tax=Hymenobacter ginkgonis TaxID=2682976 RepID=A0A7K1TEV7_9BACT|nr:IPT/TIG domain-containing protein [Hymenobacter ginkgonis]MVN76934.1 hypothetical protein [Hymenobacter ginkgonis]